MKKDYSTWTLVKQKVNNSDFRVFECKEREVWICNLGENIGFEEDGKGEKFTRPVLILRQFNKNFCYIVPLSTTEKRGKYYFPFESKTGRTSVALLSQAKPIDKLRLSRKLGYASKEDFIKIKQELKKVLF